VTNEVIKTTGLSYDYPDGTEALRGVDLAVRRGESVALIGPNGAGKSTLLLHLNGFLTGHTHNPGGETHAAVEVCGLEVCKRNLAAIRAKVGMVFQDSEDQLFMPTVFDDVAFGPLNMGCGDAEVRERVARALAEVEMTHAERKAPYHLSGGEKRRVAIATVLSMSPEILVMDEPTGNLDPRGRRALIRLLKKLTMTKLVATHDLELVLDLCTRAVLLDHGKVVADGDTRAILSDAASLEAHGLEKPPSLRDGR